MRRILLMLASVALGVALLFGASSSTDRGVQAAPGKPNIVFILTDDMRKDDLKYMPKTRKLLGAGGMTFSNAFVSNPLCCPARATTMRGQYAHNTDVWTNRGWKIYRNHGGERDNVATRLNSAGYRTGLFGKYLNGYSTAAHVPPGWDRWFALLGPLRGYYNYKASDDGRSKRFGSGRDAYQTDVLRRQTEAFIGASADRGKPFFAYVAPYAPHGPATPAPRHKHAYDGLKVPRSPSFNEKNVSDKPSWVRRLPKIRNKSAIDNTHEKRAESLQAVDDLVAAVVGKLKDKGELSNTYIFFSSDNGWHQGEHRIARGKARPYEEDVRVPLLVRGPGIRAGSTNPKLALNTDYLPTFTDLAGTKEPSYVDGRSLRPLLRGTGGAWRSAILLEGGRGPSPAYSAIRTSTSKYVAYTGGGGEYYDLQRDPHELVNKYRAGGVPTSLAWRLQALQRCAGATCRTAENGW